MQMSIHRSLAELKLLDKRITSSLSTTFTALYKNGKAPIGFKTVKEFEENATSKFDSLKALIERRNNMRSAIVASNASTDIKIGTETYKVAEAINRKSDIKYEVELLDILKQQFVSTTRNLERISEQLEKDADQHVITVFANKVLKEQEKDMQIVRKNFIENNKQKLSDPLGIRKEIEEMEKEIETFINEVDYSLSESNAKTIIEFAD
jgi:hypothetical protein